MTKANNAIGQQIRRLRKARLRSQEVLSEQIGIDPKSLGRIEKGDYYPALDTLMRLSKALDVPLRDFFPISEQTPENPLASEMRHALIDFVYSANESDLLSLYKYYVKLIGENPK
ncbi:MAG: helix-turn-helix transcriptional regulator [Burkholderiaceae bacterium]|nr:helix-turn-helix transcriptional regulator [Burkholderiaceae bacterium]